MVNSGWNINLIPGPGDLTIKRQKGVGVGRRALEKKIHCSFPRFLPLSNPISSRINAVRKDALVMLDVKHRWRRNFTIYVKDQGYYIPAFEARDAFVHWYVKPTAFQQSPATSKTTGDVTMHSMKNYFSNKHLLHYVIRHSLWCLLSATKQNCNISLVITHQLQ